MGGCVGRTGEKGHAHISFIGKPQGKRPIGRPMHRCEDNIKMVLKEIRREDVNYIHLAQDRVK